MRYKVLEQANREVPIKSIGGSYAGSRLDLSERNRAFERIMSLQLPTPIYKLDTARDLLRKHNVRYVSVFERILSTHPLSNLDDSFPKAGKGRDLLSAISRRDIKEAKRLLDLGVDINCFDKNGDTLLHLIVKNRLISLLTPLLKLVSCFDLIDDDVRFMVDCKNYEGKTWLNCCEPEVKAEIEQALRNYLIGVIYVEHIEDREIIENIVEIFNVDVNQSRNGISLFDRAKYVGNDYTCRYLERKGGKSAGLNDEDKEIIDLERNLCLRKEGLKDIEEEVLDSKQQKQRKETQIIELTRSLQNKEKDILTLTNNLESVKESSQKLRGLYESIQKGALDIEKQLRDKQQKTYTSVRYCACLSAAGTLAFILTFPYIMYFETFSVALPLSSAACCLVSLVWFVYLKINMSKIFDKDSINLSEITLSESKVHPLIQSNASFHIQNDTIKELNSNCDLVTTDLSEEIEDRKGYIVNLRNKLENVKQDIENKSKLVEPLKQVIHNTKEEISKLKEQIQVKEKKIFNLTQYIKNVNQAISKCREFRSDVHKNALDTEQKLKIQIDNKVNEYVHYAILSTLPGAIGSISVSLIALLPDAVPIASTACIVLGLSMCIYMACCFASVPGAYFLISEMPSKEPNIELPKSCMELESFFNSKKESLKSFAHI
ncbi:hypothetical protein NOX90_03545 [Wolbachia endosymbiont of Anurida maritima]|uniref:ankyrin repeat domain-containing protein n=1 Tax=Wolbachia endosymbiont of Anurida maritima TaxID=2850562 RepID=UPI0035CF8A16